MFLPRRPPTWFGAPGSVAVWSATVDPGDTPRPLRVAASVPVQVFVNGQLVIDHSGDYDQPTTAIVSGDESSELLVVARIPPGSEPEVFAIHLDWQQPGGGWTAFMPYVPRDPT